MEKTFTRVLKICLITAAFIVFSATAYFAVTEANLQVRGVTGYIDRVIVTPREFSDGIVSEANLTKADSQIGILEIREENNWQKVKKIPVRIDELEKITKKQMEGEESVRLVKKGIGKTYWKISKTLKI